MALIKEIELENGVIINYHKITSFNKITNISNNIEVSSYTNKSQRKKEKRYQDLQKKKNNNEELTLEEEIELNKGINVFIYTTFYQIRSKKMRFMGGILALQVASGSKSSSGCVSSSVSS